MRKQYEQTVTLVLLFLISQVAMAATWVESPSRNHNGNLLIDIDSIKKHNFGQSNGFYITAWIQRVYPDVKILPNGKIYNRVNAFMYFDCQNSKSTYEEIIGYYANNSDAVSYEKNKIDTRSSKNWTRVSPNSVSEAQLYLACDAYEIGTSRGVRF